MHGVLHAVATDDAGLRPIEFAAELLTFGKQPAAGQPAEAAGDDGPLDFHLECAAGRWSEPHAAEAKTIFRPLVAPTADIEPDLAIHQLRQIKRNHAGVVRHKLHAV